MISRVFLYSNEESKKNGTYTELKTCLLITGGVSLLFFILLMVTLALSGTLGAISIILSVAYIIFLEVYLYQFFTRNQFKKMAYATDTEGRIYQVFLTSYNIGYYVRNVNPGIAMNGNCKNIGGNTFRYEYTREQALNDPNIVAQIIQNRQNMYGVMLSEILQVNSFVDKGKKVAIKCDCNLYNLGTVRLQRNTSILIGKSYNAVYDLLNMLYLMSQRNLNNLNI